MVLVPYPAVVPWFRIWSLRSIICRPVCPSGLIGLGKGLVERQRSLIDKRSLINQPSYPGETTDTANKTPKALSCPQELEFVLEASPRASVSWRRFLLSVCRGWRYRGGPVAKKRTAEIVLVEREIISPTPTVAPYYAGGLFRNVKTVCNDPENFKETLNVDVRTLPKRYLSTEKPKQLAWWNGRPEKNLYGTSR